MQRWKMEKLLKELQEMKPLDTSDPYGKRVWFPIWKAQMEQIIEVLTYCVNQERQHDEDKAALLRNRAVAKEKWSDWIRF